MKYATIAARVLFSFIFILSGEEIIFSFNHESM